MNTAIHLWPTYLVILLAFGIAPGATLRLLVLIYPKEHPRRRELLAELYGIEYRQRPLFVAQQIELALFEGIPARWRARRLPDTTPTETPMESDPVPLTGPQVAWATVASRVTQALLYRADRATAGQLSAVT